MYRDMEICDTYNSCYNINSHNIQVILDVKLTFACFTISRVRVRTLTTSAAVNYSTDGFDVTTGGFTLHG